MILTVCRTRRAAADERRGGPPPRGGHGAHFYRAQAEAPKPKSDASPIGARSSSRRASGCASVLSSWRC